jgi:tRNA splicing endonuclease
MTTAAPMTTAALMTTAAPMTTAAAQLALAPPSAAMAVARCLVFAELWSRGYWISPGYRFGVDFLVYEGSARNK